MSEMYAISRIQNYKFSDVGGVLKEALRILPNYDNPDCNPELSYLNVALVDCDLDGLTPEKYILKYREDNDIKGRFNTNASNPKNLTNCMFQTLFTCSKDYLDNMTRDEQIDYFQHCLDFFKSEFPTAHILAANIHFDETTPHMHVTALPTVVRHNKKKDVDETIFSTTKLMPGKDFFPKYQDRFYSFISSKYDGFTRSHSNRKNMSVQTYKQYRELEKKYFLAQQELFEYRQQIAQQKKYISDLYAELSKLRKVHSFWESVPLIGFFVSIVMELRQEEQERLLKLCIKEAQQELDFMKENQHTPLNDVIHDAESKRKLSPSKQKILDRLFNER